MLPKKNIMVTNCLKASVYRTTSFKLVRYDDSVTESPEIYVDPQLYVAVVKLSSCTHLTINP